MKALKTLTALGLMMMSAGSVAAEEQAQGDARRAAFQKAWAEIGIKDYQAPEVRQFTATDIKTFPAVEAGQGAAADATHFYAVVNYVIGKYDRETGGLVGRWVGDRGGLIGHLNSCYVEGTDLLCANSNHPNLPMASTIEVFDTATMTHKSSKSLGLTEEGSLVWFDRYEDGWIAGFANYDDETGLPYKDHTYAGIVLFDEDWRRRGGYALPGSLLAKMAPQAASGGAIGPDGRLYVMGHDLPEMYVLDFPPMGPTMVHVATLRVPSEGQAFAFDPVEPQRVWAISRPRREVVTYLIPETL